MSKDELAIREAFRGKNIFLTGASGFLGKVWLCLVLQKVTEVGKIFVLLRGKAGLSAKQRLEKIINSSPVFSVLHETHREGLESFLEEHLQVVEGDVALPFFGMTASQVRGLSGTVDLIVNCAGLVDFSPDLRDAFRTNVQGALHAAGLARAFPAALLHVSTAYVAGNRAGEIEERLVPNYCPSGNAFDAELEYQEIERLLDESGDNWIDLGLKRANQWGWPNAYSYSKSLAESLLALQANDLGLSIFRPTIVESALHFPFPGWNEGITTCAPLSYFAANSLRVLPMKPSFALDLVPVDLVCKGMAVASAALLTGTAERVYHCGTSDLNPLSQRFALELMNLNHRQYFQANGKGIFEKLYLARSSPMIVEEKSFFTATNLKKLTAIAIEFAELVSPHLPASARASLEKGKRGLKKLKWEFIKAERILETFKPFLLLYDYVFKTGNLRKRGIRETEFEFRPEKISWSDYIVNVQEPGLRKWCYPLIEGREVEEYRPARACSLHGDEGHQGFQSTSRTAKNQLSTEEGGSCNPIKRG